jgi:hypothetical protein
MRANEVVKIVRINDDIAELWTVSKQADGFHCKFWTLDKEQLAHAEDWQKYGGGKPVFLSHPKGERVFDTVVEIKRYFGDAGHKHFGEHATELLNSIALVV